MCEIFPFNNWTNFTNLSGVSIDDFEQVLFILLFTCYLFCFNEVTKTEVLKEINSINNKKANSFNTIPSKILKISSECSADTLTSLINKSLTSSKKFPANHKLADITPICKKKNPQAKENYRPVSVLPVLSKVFERLMQKQINSFFTDYLWDFYVVTDKVSAHRMP